MRRSEREVPFTGKAGKQEERKTFTHSPYNIPRGGREIEDFSSEK